MKKKIIDNNRSNPNLIISKQKNGSVQIKPLMKLIYPVYDFEYDKFHILPGNIDHAKPITGILLLLLISSILNFTH